MINGSYDNPNGDETSSQCNTCFSDTLINKDSAYNESVNVDTHFINFNITIYVGATFF